MDYLSQAQDILKRGRQAASSASSSSTARTASTTSTWGSTAQQPKQDWTLRGLYGEAYRAMGWNQQMGMQLFSLIDQEKQDPNSKFYSRYSQPTNQAVKKLQSYGFDTSVLNDDWFSENMGWIQSNLEYRSGTGNSPSAPTKKSTLNNRIAYELYQYSIAEDRTKKAENEVGSALADAMYWAQRSDLNLSDDDIVDRVKQNIEKNYSTLSSMKNDDLSPLELNRAVEFSDDMLYGAVWAARNPSFQGNIEQAMAASYLGMGQTWHVNEEIEQKRNRNNPDTYAPYSIGMTMDDAGRFFGVSRFDDNTIKEIRSSLDFNDSKAVKHYEDVVRAEETTKKAEEQKSTIDGLVSKWLGKDYSEEKILNLLDKELAKSDYSVLNQMDLTITNGLDPIGLTRAVDYSKRDLVNHIKDEIAKRGDKLSVTEVANGTQSANPIPEKVKTVDEINMEAETLARTAHINKPATENQQIGATDQVDAAQMLSVGKEPEKPTYVQTPEQQAKAAYDARYGAGAYDRDIQAAEQAKTVSYGAQAQKDSDAMVRDTVADIDDELTPAESNRLGNYSGASDAAQAQLKSIKTNAGNNPESIESIVNKSTAGVTKDYIEGTIGLYGRANQYEYTQYNLTQLQTTEEELLAMLGDKIYAGKQADTFFTTEVNGNQYRVQMSGDMTEIEAIDNINNPDVPTPVYASYGLYDSPDEYDDDTKVWQAIENSGEVDAFRAKHAEETARIEAANQLEITEEDEQALKALRETQIGIEDAQAYIAENKDQYDQDLEEFNRQAERRSVHIQNLQAMGIDTTAVETADTVLNYLTNFTSYEATRWETYNPSYKYAVMIEDGEDRDAVLATAKDEHNEILEQIKDVEWLQGYLTDHNIKIPDDVQNNIDRRLAKLQRDAKDYDFFAKQWEGDFEEYAAKGEAQEQEEYLRYNATHRTNNPDEVPGSLYNLVGAYNTYMSDDEKKTFYYLKAKDAENNTNEAEEYARFLADETYGVLQVRGREGMEKSAEEIVDSGWLGAVTANVGAVLLSPYTAISGLAYDAYVWASGNEFNPNSSFLNAMHFRSKTREATAKEILEGLGTKKIDEKTGEITYEENAATKIAQGGYEMLTNRADSMVNAAFFGWMFGGIGNSVLQEFMSAAPMGLSAAYEAVARAKERGASDAQAYGVAAVTFFAETATEAISLENMGEAFGLGKEVGAGTYKEFLKNWLAKAGISEAFGESVNDIVENFADEKIMGVMSDHANLVYEYRMQGYSKEEAELMAREDEVKGVLRTALISYLSPGLDVIQTVRGRYHYYGDVTRELQQNGYNDATIRSVRKGIRAEERAQIRQERQNAERPMGPINYDLLEERYGVKAPAAENTVMAEAAQTTAETEQAQAEQAKRESEQFIVEFEILETAKTYDQAGQQAAISSVLDENAGEAETDMANAASVNLGSALGADVNAVDEIQTLMTGSRVESVSIGMVKQGLQYAALGGESSASRQAIQSQEYKTATPDVKARMLAEAAQADMQNETVQQNVQKAVFEDRVAKAEGVLLAQGAGKLIAQAEQKVQAAAENTKKATDMLNTQQDVLQAAREAMTAAAVQVENDPASNDNVQMLNHAITELENQGKVAQEYEQSLANAQQKEQETRDQTANVKKEEMLKIRQNAERMVREQDQQRAEAQAQFQAEETARIQAEQEAAAQLQAQEDEASGRAEEIRQDTAIDQAIEQQNLTPEATEEMQDAVKERRTEVKERNVNLDGMVSNVEGLQAVKAFGRKLGLNIEFADMAENTRGKYQNGTIYLNQNRIKSGKLTVGQALVEASLHEITHAMENTNSYQTYKRVVLDSLFGGDQAAYQSAIDQKIADYKEAVNQDLTQEDAEKEIIADFARLNLAQKDVVQRFMDAGLGGRMRNTLHNVNQALKNFFGRMTGEERQTAENLRKAERAFQKAMVEAAKTSAHPEGDQFSVVQFAQAAGMNVDIDTLTLYDRNGNVVDGVNNRITADMMNNTPVGMLIDLARDGSKTKKGNVKFAPTISAETAQAQKQMFADLMNMVAQYKDSDLVWEIASSTLFSAMKKNSDPQYSTTVDFGTICAKTQEIIDVMSRVMLEEGRGLERDEVLKVYNETANAGLTVPCPVCYVFSRWMGVPSLLNKMSQYQKDYVKLNEDGTINVKETQKAADAYIKAALDEYGDKEGIDKAKNSINNRRKTQEKNRTDALTVLNSETATAEEKAKAQTKHDEAVANLVSLDKEMGKVEAYNWITQALLNDKGKVDPNFELTPDEVLFDLRRTGEFAKYTKNWRYRNTRGAGMGKAIMPYSGETIGDIIFGTERKSELTNPFLMMTMGKAANGVKNAIARARQQNLIGGQRLQSTSDFRPEWGLDYMMSFLELQAVGSKVQMYTKVAEAVDLLASMGADINLSIMGQGQGWHTDENGKQVLDFSDVTGMNYETAKELKNKYDNVQMILVGMNDTHIKLAMENPDIDFIIPWHSSGNSKDTLSRMISSVGESLDASSDYTDTQSDSPSANQTAEQKALWNLRMKILQGQKITAEERDTIYHDQYLKGLYDRFNVEGIDPDCYQVKLGKDQAKQIFPYEYWDKSIGKADADQNGQAFIDYCQHFGIVPRFSGVVKKSDDGSFTVTGNFAGAIYDENGNITGYDPNQMYKGYWKSLIDRPMYDNNGNYRDQQVVDVTKAKVGRLENGKLTDSDMPLSTSAMYGPDYSEQEKNAVDNSLAAIREQAGFMTGQYSVYQDNGLTAADLDLMNDDYMDAVANGDMETAQRDVDEAAEAAGYTIKAYHGTSQQFTVFDKSKSGQNWNGDSRYGPGFYFAYDRDTALKWTDGTRVVESYLKMENPLDLRNAAPDNLADVIRDYYANDKEYDPSFPLTYEQYQENLKRLEEMDINNPAYFLSHLKYDSEGEMTDGIFELLSSLGFDGIVTDEEMVVFNPDQIKSAAPVTYDDNGNVIPLSERFNTTNPDIRYSASGDMTAADMDIDQVLIDTGVVTPEELKRLNRSDKGEGLRQFNTATGQKADVFDQRALDYIKQHGYYVQDTNSAELTRAINWITKNSTENDPDGYKTSLEKVTSDSFNYRTKDGQARMIAMMGMAAARGDVTAQVQLLRNYGKQGTDLGQALQARKMFSLMTPEGRMKAMDNMLKNTQAEINKKGTNITLEFSDWVYRAASMAETEADYKRVQQMAAAELAEQVPSTWKDKLTEFRMLAMLANPRTHIRNIVGNALFVPAVSLKNKLGAVGEMITGQEERTKTLKLTVPKEIRDFVSQDAVKNKDVLTGEAKYNEATMIKQSQSPLGKFVKALSDLNSKALEGEDWMFLKGHYKRALGGWITANGYTVDQLQNDQALLEKGREYAINEAQKATYRDFNKIASQLNEVSRKGGALGFLVDATLPFKKTPANILRRGVEYSPAGIVKSLTTDMYHMKQYLDYQKGKLNELPEKAMSPNQVIDHLCSGLSGTGVMMLGFLLAGTGAVSCGFDDDDEFDKIKGGQEYAVNLGKAGNEILGLFGVPKLFGEDMTFTLDWAAPMSMPLFVGAAIRNQMDQEGDVDIEQVLNAMGAISEPVFNLSMLDGVNTLFKTSSYDNTNPITQILAKIGTNYASSFVPSALGAVARTIDDKQRKAFVEQGKSSGVLGNIRYAIEQAQNKIPGLNQQNIAARDIWGEEKTSGLAERILENFILPGYVSNYKEDPVLDEWERVYEATGKDKSIMPDEDPDKSISYTRNGVTHKKVLTDKEWDHYKEVRNKMAYQELSELFNTQDYQDADANAQAKMIKDIWDHANKIGKKAVDPEYDAGETKTVNEIAHDSKVSSYQTEMIKDLQRGDYDAYDDMVEAIYQEYDSDQEAKSAIKTKLGNTFRDEWKEAYMKGDTVRMMEIEDMLEYTGLDFNIYGKGGWEEKADEKMNR